VSQHAWHVLAHSLLAVARRREYESHLPSTHPHASGHGHGHAHHTGALRVGGWFYDFTLRWFVLRGQERNFRRLTLDLAHVAPGETVLDVGCGTGTLALAAAERVGGSGRVIGIDPAAQLLARARKKAARLASSAEFHEAGIETLPLPDNSIDAALGTFMMHHVPNELVRRGLAEVRRVMKPGGRLLLIDFERAEHDAHGHAGALGIQDIPELMREAGLEAREPQDLTTTFRIRSLSRAHRRYGYAIGVKPLAPRDVE
jgi:ubiquinone/menaquinone biosynthesis C-methylase UbiE